jgi:hypothetical protein
MQSSTVDRERCELSMVRMDQISTAYAATLISASDGTSMMAGETIRYPSAC